MCIEHIINILSPLSVLIASIIGIIGFNSWRKEVRFKRKHELAEEILANAYEAEHVINFIRFPASRNDEGLSREQNNNETPNETKHYNNLYIIKERFLKSDSSFKKLFSIKYRVKAVFGSDIEESLSQLLNLPSKIISIVDSYADTYINPDDYTKEEKIEIQKEYSSTVFSNLSNKEKDPIYMEMHAIVSDLEEKLRKIIK